MWKSRTLLTLTVLLLAAGVASAAQGRKKDRKPGRGRGLEQQVAKMKAALGLTDEQAAKLAEAMKARQEAMKGNEAATEARAAMKAARQAKDKEAMKAASAQMREAMKETNEQYEAALKAFLTEEQIEKLKGLRKRGGRAGKKGDKKRKKNTEE